MMGGGILMLIGSFLDWRFANAGLSTDAMGLLGILTLLFAIAIIGVPALRMFSPSTALPGAVAGFAIDKVLVILAATVFLWTFGQISADRVDFGTHLTWIGAAVAAVGGVMTMHEAGSPATTSS